MITTTYEIIKPIIIPIILTCDLLKYQIIQAIIATKYRHIFPVEICIVSGLLALAKQLSNITVLIAEPVTPMINPKINAWCVKGIILPILLINTNNIECTV